ncbi:hypothetical protein [Streptomyces sp. NPDC007856]|uniref:hypothetical protein n=1 Tax=Streptomyces sp. NPDC007856 TaxID=3364781 RepID=UPI0036A61A57
MVELPGPPPKPVSDRQGRHRADLGIVRLAGEAPAAPPKLCAAANRAWNDYWTDVIAGVLRPGDAPLVDRWIHNVDRYHRIMRLADKEPVVEGSTGQQKPNGLYDLAFKIEASIKADEQQLGIGPLNRLRLGVKIAEGAKSLADLTAEAEEGDDDDDPRAFLTG